MKIITENEQKEKAKTDACFISELINDLNTYIDVKPDNKFGTMLLDWQKELMKTAGFENIEEVKDYHAETVGAEYW